MRSAAVNVLPPSKESCGSTQQGIVIVSAGWEPVDRFGGEQRTHLDTADATPSTRVCNALDVDGVGVTTDGCVVARHADDALHRQGLDDRALVDAHTALSIRAGRVDVLAVCQHITVRGAKGGILSTAVHAHIPVVLPADVRSKVAVQTRARVQLTRLG